MKTIQLTRGLVAIVDDEDFERLAQYHWCADVEGYAVRTVRKDGKQWNGRMHTEVLGKKEGYICDHINGVRTDNRRENLRFATAFDNAGNRRVRHDSTLKIKGVAPHGKKFRARIRINGKQTVIGTFATIEQAKAAHDAEALRIHGEFAAVNRN